MKIKLAILEMDKGYLNKIVSVFNAKFSDKLEIYSFTDKDVAMNTLKNFKVDVFIVNEAFGIDESDVPFNCAFAYLVNSADIDTLNNQKAICKFQKVEVIYREILGLYSEKSGTVSTLKPMNGSCRVIMFSSPAGGVGTTTMAAAYAVNLARQGRSVLYLNLEKLGSADTFFSADGSATMSDVLFALKSNVAKLSFKLESCVKKDDSGVYFFSQSRHALDMYEQEYADWIRLINELQITGQYEYIVVDIDFSMQEEYFELYQMMEYVVWVNNGTDITNGKTYRAFQTCRTMETEMEKEITNKIVFVYNKFSNKTSKIIDNELGVSSIGGVPTYRGVTNSQIVQEISAMGFFEMLY